SDRASQLRRSGLLACYGHVAARDGTEGRHERKDEENDLRVPCDLLFQRATSSRQITTTPRTRRKAREFHLRLSLFFLLPRGVRRVAVVPFLSALSPRGTSPSPALSWSPNQWPEHVAADAERALAAFQ